MKIRDIRAVGLRGATPEGGWSNEIETDDCVHTLIAVYTDDGPTGYGSVFTSEALVRGSLAVLRPLYHGENALEPERVSEKLHQHTFGRGGAGPSPTRSAALTSPSGTFWARPPVSLWAVCWAGATGNGSSPTLPC